MTLFTFVTELILQPVMVHAATFWTNYSASVSLSLKMLNAGLFVGELCAKFNDIHKNYKY